MWHDRQGYSYKKTNSNFVMYSYTIRRRRITDKYKHVRLKNPYSKILYGDIRENCLDKTLIKTRHKRSRKAVIENKTKWGLQDRERDKGRERERELH